MTVLIEQVITQYSGTGSRKLFEYGFEVFDDTQVFVTVNGSIVDFIAQDNGVVIDPAPPLGSVILIYRETDVTQLRDFQPFEAFKADKTESAVDKLIYLKQEANIWRARLNLYAIPFVDRVTLDNDKGTDADLFLWNLEKAGMFSGEVTTDMPEPGTFVDKPWDFAYFQYGTGATTYDLILTTTPYPIEVIEKLQMGGRITDGDMRPIPVEQHYMGSFDALGSTLTQLLFTLPAEEEQHYMGAFNAIDSTLVEFLVTLPAEEERHYMGPVSALDGTLEEKLVEIDTPDEELQLDASVYGPGCSMTSV